MNQFQQFDRRLSVHQKQLAQPIETGKTEQKILPVMPSLWRPRWLLVTALVAFLSAGAPFVLRPMPPVPERHPVALVAESLAKTEIPNELAAFMVPAALTPTKLANPSKGKPIDQLTEADSLTSGDQTTAASHTPADGESNQGVPKAAQPSVNKDAFFGEVLGVASITVVFDDERSPVVEPDQPIGVTDRDNRTSYAVATPRYRNKDEGDFHLTELTVQFLFRGRQPLDVSLQASHGAILLDEHIQVEDDPERRRQLLETWWASYSQQRDGYSGELDWLHRSVVEMLARRLELSLPNGWSKKLERRSMAKVEQDFERILSTLLGIDSLLIAMGQDSTSIINGADVIADQPLPNAINIRPVETSSVTRDTTVEEIAMRVPQECFYVRCGTLHNYEWLRSFLMHWNGSLEEIVKVAATDRSVRQRLEKQLALDLETCKSLGLEQEISDVALIGCDLNFDDGPAIGVVFEAKNEQAVQRIINEQRKNILAKHPDAKEGTIEFRQRRVSIVYSPGYVIRSYSVSFGKYHLVTNSTFIVRRFFEASDGSRSLGRLDEFKLARQKVPSADSNVVQIYLSDPFFRQVVSPKFRIEASRRERAAEDLKHLALTSAIARAEGIDQISVDELKELKYLPPQFNRRADNSAAQFVGSTVRDSVRGAWGTFKPIADVELDRATRAEVSEYQRFASLYQGQWQRMDPVVANLSVTPNSLAGTESVKLDILVVPFAPQRYDVFNRYLASGTSREIATHDNDLIAVTAGLHSPQGGTMLARMGIQDRSVKYRIENGQVLTTGKHSGMTLAKSNLYVLIDSAGTAGLKRLGDFVQSLQGNSPVPITDTTQRAPRHVLDMLFALPRLFGGIAKAGSIETQGNWTIMSPRKELRERVGEMALVQSTTANAQVRFKMNDVNRSQAAKYINAYTYVESRKVSSANAALLNYVGQQLPLPVDEAPAIIEQVLGVKLVCPLGRKYRLADRLGYRYWTAATEENESYFKISAVPEDYRFPFLNWLRGMELEFNLSDNTLTSNVRLTTKQSLPSHPNDANIRESGSENPSDSSIARGDTTIGPGDTVLVTATTAQLKVPTGVLAEIPKGQYLQVLKVQDHWIWTFVEKKGARTHGWINIQQVAKRPIVLAEMYLHSGELAKGEQALEDALLVDPDDDQIRFGLGVLQFVRGVERLGQSLHQYGAKSENTNIPFLRLPVPKNPDPAPITYTAFRRMLDDFVRDLRSADATLAGVTDDQVKLPLRLANIRVDLDGDGNPTDKFIDILKKIMRQEFAFLQENPEFLVEFDRGDVAWLRSYCHLLMGMLDGYLAFDTKQTFDLTADELFANSTNRFVGEDAGEKQRLIRDTWNEIALTEPARLGRLRRHLIKVTELNRETWENIRDETDDDYEWLPNARQKGVLGLPVRDDMIDAWLSMMAELESLLNGNRTLPKIYLSQNGQGLNLKKLFDDPPEKLVIENFANNLPDKYFSDDKDVDINVLFRVFSLFENTTIVGYAAWFN